jgi:hypothetical protein
MSSAITSEGDADFAVDVRDSWAKPIPRIEITFIGIVFDWTPALPLSKSISGVSIFPREGKTVHALSRSHTCVVMGFGYPPVGNDI